MRDANSACVLLWHPMTRDVLVELHPDGVCLPGGKREAEDASSLQCARRELYEETGVQLLEARTILMYQAGEYLAEAFLAVSVDAIPTPWEVSVRNAAWVPSERLIQEGSRFPAYCSQLFARLASGRVGPLLRCV